MRPSYAAVWKLPRLDQDAQAQLHGALKDFRDTHHVDVALLDTPYRWQDFSVLAMDMDSTVITIECIDEIADYCGKKEEVAAITEAAMRGEIKDYAESLRRRVALLAGLDAGVLQDVIRYRLKFTPGVKELIATANERGLHTLLVSGGFIQFTDFVSEKIGFQQSRSNTLEIMDGKLTGRLVGKIVDAAVKKTTMLAACKSLGVSGKRAIAVGDGANDLEMMKAAGLSIAHRAKPAVAAQAKQAIVFGGLDNVLDWFE
ncbi:MAG: phosphoserine phosphatase SerB [Burkholderiaceae bacterium]|nr:phosphoserine phosphatase SerB [Burkholderiaceae bacterium]